MTEVGREEFALRGGPEACPELPPLLDTRVVEVELRDRPAERAIKSPCMLTCENAEVKMKSGSLMGEAGAGTEDVCL